MGKKRVQPHHHHIVKQAFHQLEWTHWKQKAPYAAAAEPVGRNL